MSKVHACTNDTVMAMVSAFSQVSHLIPLPSALLAKNAVSVLVDAGLQASRIQMSDMCVSCHYELFFSYRRDSGETGRQMGFIMLNS